MRLGQDILVSDKTRLAFVGLGWIGRNRLEAIRQVDGIDIVGLIDPDRNAITELASVIPNAVISETLDDMLKLEPAGIVIATPSALHSGQAIAALEQGVAVFCQKPLGRDANETRAVVETASRVNRLLHTDLSYRYARAFVALRDLISKGDLGDIYSMDLTFHNAYGPDKSWFRDRELAGGGCLIDLGIHLIDMAQWCLDYPLLTCKTACAMANGKPLARNDAAVEDLITATMQTDRGAVIRIACSWNLPAGCDAIISADVYGTGGGARVSNIGGSFYDFSAWYHHGTTTEQIAAPPDEWGGRAARHWADQLRLGQGFDEEAWRLVDLARALDMIYDCAGR